MVLPHKQWEWGSEKYMKGDAIIPCYFSPWSSVLYTEPGIAKAVVDIIIAQSVRTWFPSRRSAWINCPLRWSAYVAHGHCWLNFHEFMIGTYSCWLCTPQHCTNCAYIHAPGSWIKIRLGNTKELLLTLRLSFRLKNTMGEVWAIMFWVFPSLGFHLKNEHSCSAYIGCAGFISAQLLVGRSYAGGYMSKLWHCITHDVLSRNVILFLKGKERMVETPLSFNSPRTCQRNTSRATGIYLINWTHSHTLTQIQSRRLPCMTRTV